MAARLIDSIYVDVSINLTKFRKGFEEINKIIQKQSGNFAKIASDASNAGDKMAKAIEEPNKRIQESFAKTITSMRNVASTMQSIGNEMTAKITLPLAIIGGIAIKTFTSYEKEMLKAKAVTQATTGEFERMKETVLDLGVKTEFTAGQAAGALADLGQLGLNASKAMQALPATIDLATAGSLELGTAATIVANIMNSMGLGINDVVHITDILAASAAQSGASVEELGVGMARVGSSAKITNQNVEDLLASIGLLRDRGIGAEVAGTELRNVFVKLSSVTKEGGKALKQYGIQIKGLDGNLKKLPDLVQEFSDKLAGLSDPDKIDVLTKIMDIRTSAMFISLMDAGAESIRTLSTGLKESKVTAKALADEMRSGLGGAIKQMTSSIQGAFIEAIETIKPTIILIVNSITSLARSFVALPSSIKGSIVAFATIAALIGPILISMATLIKTLLFVNTTLGLTSGSLGLAGKAFALLNMGIPEIISRLGLLSSSALSAGSEFIAFSKATVFANSSMAATEISLGALATRLGLIGLAIGLVVFAIIQVIGAWEDLTDTTETGLKAWMDFFIMSNGGMVLLGLATGKTTSQLTDMILNVENLKKVFDGFYFVATLGMSKLLPAIAKNWKSIVVFIADSVNKLIDIINWWIDKSLIQINLLIAGLNKIPGINLKPVTLKIDTIDGDKIVKALEPSVEKIKKVFDGMGGFIEGRMDSMKSFFSFIWEKIAIGSKKTFDKMGIFGQSGFDQVIKNTENFFRKFKELQDKFITSSEKGFLSRFTFEPPVDPDTLIPKVEQGALHKDDLDLFGGMGSTRIDSGGFEVNTPELEYEIELLREIGAIEMENSIARKIAHSEEMSDMLEKVEAWSGFKLSVEEVFKSMQQASANLFQMMAEGFASAIAEMMVYGGSFKEMMTNLWKQIAAAAIKALIMIGIQALLTAIMTKTATTAAAPSIISAKAGEAHAAGVASWSAAPWPINAGAPAFGLAMGAAAMLGMGYLAGGTAEEGGIINGHGLIEVGEKGKKEIVVPLEGSNKMMGGDQTIVVMLDNETLLKTVVRGMPEYIRLKTGGTL